MKQIVIIIVVLILIFVGSYISQNYIRITSDQLISQIDELKEELQKSIETRDNKKSAELAENIINKWDEIEEKWSILVLHNELDNIELALIGMKSHIETEQYADGMEELEKSKFLLEHITQRERFSLKNVF